MRRIKNNNLLKISIIGKESNLYFTSLNKAGWYLGLQPSSVKHAITKHNKIEMLDGEYCHIEIVDGAEIPYKYINNI